MTDLGIFYFFEFKFEFWIEAGRPVYRPVWPIWEFLFFKIQIWILNWGRFDTGPNRNRAGPVWPITDQTGPVPTGFANPGYNTHQQVRWVYHKQWCFYGAYFHLPVMVIPTCRCSFGTQTRIRISEAGKWCWCTNKHATLLKNQIPLHVLNPTTIQLWHGFTGHSTNILINTIHKATHQ